MDGPKFGRAGARKQAARIGGWRPKNWKSGDQSRCRERPEFGNDPELEQCGPKIGKARQPAASGGSRRLENQYLSIISIVLKTACPSTPRSAAPGCLFCRRPLTRRRPAADPPPSGIARLCRLPRRSLLPAGLSGVPPRRRRPAVPLVAPSAASSRRPLGSSSPPTPTRRLPGPPVSTGCPAGRRRLCRLLRRPLLPVGLSGVPLRRRRPAASRGHRFRLVAPPVAAASAGCCAGRSFPSASREFLSADTDPSPPEATGFDRLLRRSLLPAGHSH